MQYERAYFDPLGPEAVAMAATRAANGLPPEPDPAVIQANTTMPAGHYDKRDKMKDAAANKG